MCPLSCLKFHQASSGPVTQVTRPWSDRSVSETQRAPGLLSQPVRVIRLTFITSSLEVRPHYWEPVEPPEVSLRDLINVACCEDARYTDFEIGRYHVGCLRSFASLV